MKINYIKYNMRYCILLSPLREIKKIKILKRGDKNAKIS